MATSPSISLGPKAVRETRKGNPLLVDGVHVRRMLMVTTQPCWCGE